MLSIRGWDSKRKKSKDGSHWQFYASDGGSWILAGGAERTKGGDYKWWRHGATHDKQKTKTLGQAQEECILAFALRRLGQ